MNGFLYKLIVVAATIILVNTASIQYYTTKYDHLDIEQIMNNRRMVNYYGQCLLSKGPCPPQGLDFKRILPEALETNCLRCTDKQKAVTYRTIKRLKKEYPKIWKELQELWDPNNIYVPLFEETYRNTPSTTPSENEIILEDRFGPVEVSTKPTTTTVKTTKSATTGKTFRPSINNINNVPAASEHNFQDVRPLVPLRPVITSQQVGESAENIEQPAVEVAVTATVNNITIKYSSPSTTPTIIDSSLTPTPEVSTSSVVSNQQDSTTTLSSNTPVHVELTIPPLIRPLLDTFNPGVIFDIPPSSMNHSQTVAAIYNLTSIPIEKPLTTTSTVAVTKKPTVSFFQPGLRKQAEAITSIISSFLGRSPSVTLEATENKNNTKKSKTGSSLQLKLPGLSANLQGVVIQPVSDLLRSIINPRVTVLKSTTETLLPATKTSTNSYNDATETPYVFDNKHGDNTIMTNELKVKLPDLTTNLQTNLGRGSINVGDRILEAGTSIADTVWESVRSLLAAPRQVRRNRNARKRHRKRV